MLKVTMTGLGILAVAALGLAPIAAADRPSAQIVCAIKENGAAATGTVRVLKNGNAAHSGACSGAIALQPGRYSVVVGLDGALDGPEQTFEVDVRPGETKAVEADFATGQLQVRIQSEGQQAAGMAIIRRQGKQLGTLGSGVSAHLSVGTYEVVARYRLKSQEFTTVTITRGQTTALDARF